MVHSIPTQELMMLKAGKTRGSPINVTFEEKPNMISDRDRALFRRNALHAPMFQSKVGQGFRPSPLLNPTILL
jgi:hypothetical protein